MKTVLVLHGPNLNLLGRREPQIYGVDTLESINSRLEALGTELGLHITCYQHNHEGALVDRIQAAADEGIAFILINPAAYTHTSVALRDALTGTAIPFIEVHLSNVHAREGFRQHSYLSDKAVGVITGLGAQGYELALRAAAQQINTD